MAQLPAIGDVLLLDMKWHFFLTIRNGDTHQSCDKLHCLYKRYQCAAMPSIEQLLALKLKRGTQSVLTAATWLYKGYDAQVWSDAVLQVRMLSSEGTYATSRLPTNGRGYLGNSPVRLGWNLICASSKWYNKTQHV